MRGKKTGGRKLGTKNKPKINNEETILKLSTHIEGYIGSEQFLKDLEAVGPSGRLSFVKDTLNYIAPKMQAQSMDISTSDHVNETLTERVMLLAKGSND